MERVSKSPRHNAFFALLPRLGTFGLRAGCKPQTDSTALSGRSVVHLKIESRNRMTAPLTIRQAGPQDAAVIAAFNRAMALETEGKQLIPELIEAGVKGLLANPAMGFYVVAERNGEVIASLMITTEWSDWRNGIFWWVQSVYVDPQARRQGVYSSLYRHLRERAAQEPGVCGFRLYVEKENLGAQKTYGALGMSETDYLMFEEMKPGIRFLQD